MGYPVYKLLRAVNRQYPNNGFINYVDVREDIYDDAPNQMIDEDLRDLINETLQEVYIHVAVDEVYSFPTVPGQREYVLPEDCDLRDIQEVTRTFRGHRIPPPPPAPVGQAPIFSLTFYPGGGTGTMEPMEAALGETITLPECTFVSPTEEPFTGWNVGGRIYQPGETVSMYAPLIATAEWGDFVEQYPVTFIVNTLAGSFNGETTATVYTNEGQPVEEVPTLTLNEGFTFRGYSLDGGGIKTEEEILMEPVNEPTTYMAITEGIRYTVNIYISTVGGTGVLHYEPTGGQEQTRVMTYGGTPFTFNLEYGQTISDIFEMLQMYDENDSAFVVDLINVPITSDRNIGVAVPVIQPYEEAPADNGDGGYLADPETPADDDNGGYGDNPVG